MHSPIHRSRVLQSPKNHSHNSKDIPISSPHHSSGFFSRSYSQNSLSTDVKILRRNHESQILPWRTCPPCVKLLLAFSRCQGSPWHATNKAAPKLCTTKITKRICVIRFVSTSSVAWHIQSHPTATYTRNQERALISIIFDIYQLCGMAQIKKPAVSTHYRQQSHNMVPIKVAVLHTIQEERPTGQIQIW